MGTLHDRNPDTEKTGVVQPPEDWCLHDIALYQELLRLLHDEYIAKLSASASPSQVKLHWDSLIITLRPPTTHPPRERYFHFTQQAEIWYAS